MPHETDLASLTPRLVLVTGPSGAGRSTAIRALEDLGFEAIDNLPLSLLPRLLDGPPLRRPLALGLDTRNRDFSTAALLEALDRMGAIEGLSLELLYLDCRADVLSRRYSETRRRHPLAPAETPEDGIAREFDLLSAVRERADVLVDTSEMTVHDLRAEMDRLFAPVTGQGLAVSLHSFSYKRGLPRGLDMVFDVRFLRNPYWAPDLRALTGLDSAVQEHVAGDPRFAGFLAKVTDLTLMLLPAYLEEGKSHLAIGFGCTGGQHRSVTLAERLGRALAEEGWQVSIRHREQERRKAAGGVS
ncbi:RNase adapter RapZ [Pseudooceanicola spongiae]|uniref:RNase adapter RapZ n=1 Tax=Pseudooceanicola spongiae TaxID=2613965 RepID=A0A7L9WMH4_9RHOB|nr:RNase adapter RapZ [Pseudooceanicola spongiae]QOL81595.1 RNase adapter RapZ [Pseudooceanicola spongiae]